MSVNTTNGSYVLKTLYPQKRIERLMYTDNPLFAKIKKMDDFGGDSLAIAMRYADPAGRSATFSTAQTNKGNGAGKKFALTRVKDYSLISIENEAIEASKRKGPDAIVDLLDEEVMGGMNALKRSLATALYRNGTGSIGRRGSVASSTCTLLQVQDITNFEVGQVLVASSSDGGSLRSGSTTITAVDRNAGTFDFSGTISSWADNDYLYVQGDAADGSTNKRISGLAAWVPPSAPGATSFFGVDRTADVSRLGGQRLDISSLPMEEGLLKLAHLSAREGGRPDVCFISYEQMANLENSLGSKLQYMDTEVAGIGFRGVAINGPKGVINVLPDQNCPATAAWMLQMDTWELHHLNGAPHIIASDKLDMLREASSDAFEMRIAFYGNLACTAPGFNAFGLLAAPS